MTVESGNTEHDGFYERTRRLAHRVVGFLVQTREPTAVDEMTFENTYQRPKGGIKSLAGRSHFDFMVGMDDESFKLLDQPAFYPYPRRPDGTFDDGRADVAAKQAGMRPYQYFSPAVPTAGYAESDRDFEEIQQLLAEGSTVDVIDTLAQAEVKYHEPRHINR